MKASAVVVGIGISIIAMQAFAGKIPAPRDTQTCHPLLLASECKTLTGQLVSAKTPADREALVTDFRFLIVDREQACACGPSVKVDAATWNPFASPSH